MLEKNDNILKNYVLYKNKISILEEQNIEKDYRDWVDKSLDIRNYKKKSLLEYIPQIKLFINKSLLFLREIRFSK